MKFYDVADTIPWPDGKRIYDRHNIKAVKINEFRCPKKGEWFLSGAIPQAYRCRSNDANIQYHILKLVRTKTITEIIYMEDL